MKRTIGLVTFLGFLGVICWKLSSLPDQPVAACACTDRRYHQLAHRDGARDARDALSRGNLLLLSYGATPSWFEEYRASLKTDYGVDVRWLGGGLPPKHLIRYVRDYNQVMTGQIHSLHGNDAIKRAAEDAKAIYDEKHPPPRFPVVWLAVDHSD